MILVQDRNIVHLFKIKKSVVKNMEVYCTRQSLEMDQLNFSFDGNRLRDTATPYELNMEDDDIIYTDALALTDATPRKHIDTRAESLTIDLTYQMLQATSERQDEEGSASQETTVRLTELPEDLRLLKEEVRKLSVDCRGLVALPEWLGEFKHLKELKLERSLGEYGKMGNVCRDANWPASRMTLPSSMGNLHALRTLILSGLDLGTLPDSLGTLHALRTLTLSALYLESLPESIGRLSSLKTLEISCSCHCGQVRQLPTSFGQLSALEDLTLAGLSITSLPSSFWQLTNGFTGIAAE